MKCVKDSLSPLTNKRGVALLIVLLIITLISVLIFEFNYGTRVDLIKTKNRANLLKAFYIAKSGINGAIVVLDEDSKTYDGLDENWALEIPGIPFGEGNLFVKVIDEGGKFNINNLVENDGDEDPVARKVLKRLFEKIGLHDSLADDIIDLLKEKKETLYKVDDITELLDIDNIKLENLAKLEDVLTTDSNNKVNINTASYEVIASLSDSLTSSMADEIIKFRKDTPFKSKNDVKKVPEIDDNILLSFSSLIDIKSNAFSIHSQGEVNGIVKSISTTIIREEKETKIVKWKER